MFRNGGRGSNSRLGGSNFKPKGLQYMKIPDNYQLPPKDKFKRERSGQFELIFPINQRSEELAFALNKQVGARASMGAPNFLKMLV